MRYIKIFEEFNKLKSNNYDQFINDLKKYSIPIENWGKGNSKTVKHLFNEIINDECIIQDEGGYLVRYIEFVGIKIYYNDENGDTWYLKEEKQIFKDGRERTRKMQSSVSEKMKFGEDPIESAIRGIEEELDIIINSDQLKNRKDISYDGGSLSYPGLKAKYKGHQYICYLNESQYNPNGYIEVQEDKSTYFTWIKL